MYSSSDDRVLDGKLIKPSPKTCNPDVPSQKCQARLTAEADGTMRFHPQARGWEYPVPAVRLKRVPVESWEFCPFCLVPLPEDEVPRLRAQLPYKPPKQTDDPK